MDVDVTFKFAFEQFVRIKRNNNVSKHTITHYESTLHVFNQFFDEDNYCSDITPDTIEDYKEYLRTKEEPLASATINSYISGLRTVLYFFMKHEYMSKFQISLTKKDTPLVKTYTETELKILLKKPDTKKCGFATLRNWALSNYLLGTGNRQRTVRHLKIEDIDFENDRIVLKTVKNRTQYIIALSPRLKKVLVEYLHHRKGKPSDFLFCNRFGEQMKKGGISSAIKRYNLARGVEKTSMHLYRHTFAKNWILNGGDIKRLQEILGHKSKEMVLGYLSMFGGDLYRDFEKFNPLDTLDINYGRKSIKMQKRAT
jgi:integrase/recombinase XerD